MGAGHDFKIVATFPAATATTSSPGPNIKRPEDLRGKKNYTQQYRRHRLDGSAALAGASRPRQQRDHILLQVIGDQNIQAQAVETGIADAAALDGVYSRRLQTSGFTVLGEYSDLNQRIIGQAMIVPHIFLTQRAQDIVENYLKAEIEALAFALAPKNKSAVLKMLYAAAQD